MAGVENMLPKFNINSSRRKFKTYIFCPSRVWAHYEHIQQQNCFSVLDSRKIKCFRGYVDSNLFRFVIQTIFFLSLLENSHE